MSCGIYCTRSWLNQMRIKVHVVTNIKAFSDSSQPQQKCFRNKTMSPAQLTVDETVFIVTSSTSHICLVTLTLPPPMFFFFCP